MAKTPTATAKTMKGPGKVTQSNLVIHPTDGNLYIGYVVKSGTKFRGYFFERPRKFALAIRPERQVLMLPQIVRPKMSGTRFAMKVHFEGHMMAREPEKDMAAGEGLTPASEAPKSDNS